MITSSLIKVKVTVEAKSEQMIKISPDSFKIRVRERAEQSSANKRVVELLREHFGSRSSIRLVHGRASPSKIFSVAINE